MERVRHINRLRYGVIMAALAAVLMMVSPAVRADALTRVEVPMTCFPAPGAPEAPPCVVPVGLDAGMLDGTSGDLELTEEEDGTIKVEFSAEGLDPDWVITAWIAYYYPGPGVVPPDPIFGTETESGIAGVSAPAAPTTAGFTEGMGLEPNQMVIDAEGSGRLEVVLDYNPLQAGEGPLRNTLANTHQADAPAGGVAEQPTCCGASVQPVGSSYLRVFDSDGLQILDENRRPELVRSPVPVAFMLLVIHTDGTTHGINPGLPIFPFPGMPAFVGDHFVLGIFDLSDLA